MTTYRIPMTTIMMMMTLIKTTMSGGGALILSPSYPLVVVSTSL